MPHEVQPRRLMLAAHCSVLAGELATLRRQLRDHERLVQFRAQGATKIKLLQTEVITLHVSSDV